MCRKEEISQIAVKSMVYEVNATPKPGLVDKRNSGAHDDMDYNLFMKSAVSFADCLNEIVEIGYTYTGGNYQELFLRIRQVGIKAEKQMFACTKGVNTHKGILFSLCVLCGAAGHLLAKGDEGYLDAKEVCKLGAKMVEGITYRELRQMGPNKKMTHGERLYKQYGVTGIRGEAESGFQSVLRFGLPVLVSHFKFLDKNSLLIQVLFSLMSEVEDTNILHRHNRDVLEEVKDRAKQFIADGGMRKVHCREVVEKMDDYFSKKNISPGGSADLLAVTVFLGMLQGIEL